jgi:hypothetical protein
MTEPTLERYVPSLERARGARCEVRTRVWWRRAPVDVLGWTPAQERPLAALLVRATPKRAPDEAVAEGDPTGISYAYVPDVPLALENGITTMLDPKGFLPPDCLRYDLERTEFVGGPYRGGPVRDPSFHGFRFAEVMPQVRGVLDGWIEGQGGRENVDVRAWAWPFLWITFRKLMMSREVVLLVRPDLNLQAWVGRSG